MPAKCEAQKIRRRTAQSLLGLSLIVLVLAVFAAPSIGIAAPSPLLPDDIRKSGVITVATDAGYAPCESLAADNKTVIGFDPDIWNGLGQKLGVRVVAVPTTFSGLIAGVESGRYTVAMSCISDSIDREHQVLFVDYAFATSAIYTLASNNKISVDPLSLCGAKAAAEAGTDSIESLNLMSAHCQKNHRPAVGISQFPSANAMFNALVSGRVDFVLDDVAAEGPVRAQIPVAIRLVDSPLLPKRYTGIILRQSAKPLANALLTALKAMEADGSYDRIMRKWRLAPLELNAPGFNLASQRPLPEPQP